MITPSIYVHMDGVRDQLSKLISHLDEFPSPAEVQEHEGSRTGPAWGLSSDLRDTVGVAAEATKFMIEELVDVEELIRAAVEDLREHDEDVSDSADRLTSFVDGAVAHMSDEDQSGSTDATPSVSGGGGGALHSLY